MLSAVFALSKNYYYLSIALIVFFLTPTIPLFPYSTLLWRLDFSSLLSCFHIASIYWLEWNMMRND